MTMKKSLILALAIIGLSAGSLCGQTSSDIYLIGTSITAPGEFTGFERRTSPMESLYVRAPIHFIIRSLENGYEIRFNHYCFNTNELVKIRPVQSDDTMQIVIVPNSLLSSYHPIDVADFLATKTKAQAEAWREANKDKRVWIIDRSHGYVNGGTMTLIETEFSLPPLMFGQ